MNSTMNIQCGEFCFRIWIREIDFEDVVCLDFRPVDRVWIEQKRPVIELKTEVVADAFVKAKVGG